MTVKLLTEHHWEFLSLKGGCTDSSEPTLVKMTHCWKSHVRAHILTPTDTSTDIGLTALAAVIFRVGHDREKRSFSFQCLYKWYIGLQLECILEEI